ncbi:MAG: amidohydrolase family protein [Candidatus Delongbacteria bacterium]|nr:amidohydrolase family protein [Candidatus Delongbacteria bacterium]
MENYIIYNANILTFGDKPQNIRKGALYIGRGTILDFGEEKDILSKHSSVEEKFDAQGKLVMPGYIDMHNHLYSSFFQNVPLKTKGINKHSDFMNKFWWELTGKLSSDGIYYSAVKGIINSIKAGVTTIFNLHSSPNCIDDSLYDLSEAFEELSMRGVLAYEISNRTSKEDAEKMLKANAAFAQENKNNPLVSGMIGIYNANEVSDDILRTISKFTDKNDIGVMIHLSESEEEEEWSVAKHKKYCIDRLFDIGLLNEKTLLATANYLDETDIDIIKKSGAGVVLTPSSTAYKGFDMAPLGALFENKIPIGLGSDGIYPSIAGEAAFAYKMIRKDQKEFNSGNKDIGEIVTSSSYKLANKFVSKSIGEIKLGAAADIIMVDYLPEHEITKDNLNTQLLFGIIPSRVSTSIINGNIVMKNFEMVGIDEHELNAKYLEFASELKG